MSSPVSTASQLPLFHVVGFSGHRQLAEPTKVAQAITAVIEELRRESPGEWIALSSAAAGADLLFVRTALDLGLGWEASLPLPLVDFERDFPPEEWVEVKTLLARAEHLEVATEPGSREEAYLTGGFEIVNRCDLLLVVWDGQPARGKGGTADVVAYARAMGRPIVIINPDTKAVRRENFERLRLQDANLGFLNSVPGVESAPAGSSQDLVAAFQKKVDDAATHSSPHFRKLIAITVWLHVVATALATAALAFGWHWIGLPWGKLLLLVGALGVALIVRTQRTHHHWTRCRLAAEITRSALAIWACRGRRGSSPISTGRDWNRCGARSMYCTGARPASLARISTRLNNTIWPDASTTSSPTSADRRRGRFRCSPGCGRVSPRAPSVRSSSPPFMPSMSPSAGRNSRTSWRKFCIISPPLSCRCWRRRSSRSSRSTTCTGASPATARCASGSKRCARKSPTARLGPDWNAPSPKPSACCCRKYSSGTRSRASPSRTEMAQILYTVRATCRDVPQRGRFLAWLAPGHLLQVKAGGAQGVRVVLPDRASDTAPAIVETQYVFPSRKAFDTYLRDHAPALRADVMKHFPPGSGVTFERQIAEIACELE